MGAVDIRMRILLIEDDTMIGAAVEVELTTVLRNLIVNAIHHTPQHGTIDLRAERAAQSVTITVEDNGPGLEPAERERVFKPFYRGLGTGVVGSGLGLSIVRTLIERMDGRIELADAISFAHGLCVNITLPAASAAPDDDGAGNGGAVSGPTLSAGLR